MVAAAAAADTTEAIDWRPNLERTMMMNVIFWCHKKSGQTKAEGQNLSLVNPQNSTHIKKDAHVTVRVTLIPVLKHSLQASQLQW